jgi:hypothetical protein
MGDRTVNREPCAQVSIAINVENQPVEGADSMLVTMLNVDQR